MTEVERMFHRAYSRAEYVSDAVVHVAGVTLALIAAPALVATAVILRGDAPSVVGTTVYGAALILMLLCSGLYNIVRRPDWAGVLKRLDHSAIYMKIAGTYTPFTLISGQGAWLTLGLWGAAFAGVSLKVLAPDRFRWAGLALYLAMGWAGVLVGRTLLDALPAPVIVLMMTGGALYTFGVIFHLWETLRFHNTIWHVFVLIASMVFYAAVTVQVVLS